MEITDFATFLPPAIQEELKKIEALMGTDQLINLLQEMQEEIRTKPLAARFSTTRPAAHGFKSQRVSGSIMLALKDHGDTEAAYKKAELENKVTRLLAEILTLANNVKSTVAELRISQMEFPKEE